MNMDPGGIILAVQQFAQHERWILMARLVIAIALFTAVFFAGITAKLGAQQDRIQPTVRSTGQVPTSADDEFVKKALEAGKMEIELAKVALQQTKNPQVKRFAQTLVDHHTKANKELTALRRDRSQKGDAIPALEHPQLPDGLTRLHGAEFDRAFLLQVIKDHDEAVVLFDKEAKTGQDNSVKSFAQKTIPMLKEHLKTARELNGNAPTENRTPRGRRFGS